MSDRRQEGEPPPVREIEFTFDECAYPFVAVSERIDCRVDLAEILPRGDGEYAEFFTVTGGDPSQVVSLAEAHERVDAHLLSEYENGALFEFLVSIDCPAVALAELGALPQIVHGNSGTGHIVAEVPPQHETGAVIDSFLERFPAAALAAKRTKDALTTPFSQIAFHQELRSRLTERQHEVLETAFEAGYYEWPRECSGEAVAAELGITSPTFSQHIHAAERKLLTMVFERTRETHRH
ncbi:helix-turn-helix domain-containing protein [Natrinema ejinorense]|uniref:Bacterio-opsin activator n=1 Tax=Natrinema ejinorense TaxID=373386 RepID=A0A2A5QQW6_9EURY|nr:bacterio-opsin activator domain-containing protein [Natrinema ejinorense]PCR89248.1 bacterio-opsin activator [Natrinema ejinorense]